ncbi:MAG: PDZ domain-containing protein, partial [Planctomycetota bacterium]|nr:PDZ domain-containing protein [Planctomycetota bacterium]
SPLRIGLSWRFDKGHPGLAYITRVSTNSRADRAGLRPGHRIYRVNNEVMLTDLDLQKELNEAEGLLELQVESRGQVREVQIELANPAMSQKSESGNP